MHLCQNSPFFAILRCFCLKKLWHLTLCVSCCSGSKVTTTRTRRSCVRCRRPSSGSVSDSSRTAGHRAPSVSASRCTAVHGQVRSSWHMLKKRWPKAFCLQCFSMKIRRKTSLQSGVKPLIWTLKSWSPPGSCLVSEIYIFNSLNRLQIILIFYKQRNFYYYIFKISGDQMCFQELTMHYQVVRT